MSSLPENRKLASAALSAGLGAMLVALGGARALAAPPPEPATQPSEQDAISTGGATPPLPNTATAAPPSAPAPTPASPESPQPAAPVTAEPAGKTTGPGTRPKRRRPRKPRPSKKRATAVGANQGARRAG